MSLRDVLRDPLRDVLRDPFGSGETAIQAATIAAWDMQEAGGDLNPAKGSLVIPEVLTPASVSGPAGSLTARATTSSAYFQVASDDVFLLPDTGVKTIRYWVRSTGQAFFKKNTSAGTVVGAGDEYAFDVDGVQRSRSFVRNAADSATTSTPAGGAGTIPSGEWARIEVKADAGAGTLTVYTHAITSGIDETYVVSPGSFLRAANPFRIERAEWCLLAIFNRALTTEEREADYTPTVYADLGK